MPAVMTKATHEALLNLRKHQEELGENWSLHNLAGGLISEALHTRGYLKRPEYIKTGGE